MHPDDMQRRDAPPEGDAHPAEHTVDEHTAVTAVGPATPPHDARPVSAVASASRRRRLHDVLVGLLVVLACLSVVLTGIAFWAHYTVLNTDRYVEIVGPLARNPQTLQSLSDYIASETIAATNLEERTSEALPPRLSFLAQPITDAVNTFISKQAYEVLSSERAYELWLEINRVAHQRIVALLRGEATYGYIEGNDVKLNTLPLISEVLTRVDARLPEGLATRFDPPVITPETPPEEARQQLSDWLGRPVREDLGQVTVLTSDAVGPVQAAVRWLDRLVIILPVATILLCAAAIWLSRRRRRTIIELGIGVAVALIVLDVILRRLTATLIERLEDSSVISVIQDVVQASVGSLSDLAIWVAVAGAVLAAGAWIAGRADVTTAVVSAGDRAVRASTPALAWSAAHADLLRIAGLVGGLLLVVLFSWSWLWFVVWLLLIVAYQVFVSWLAAEWPFANEDGTPGSSV